MVEEIPKIECVITRYNENIDWIPYIKDQVDHITVYNKGNNDLLFKDYIPPQELLDRMTVIKLDNVGRIDHSIAYYITENWGKLNEVMVFLPASILMCQRKGDYLAAIKSTIKRVKTHFRGFFAPRFFKVGPKFNYNIDNYMAEGKCNKNDNKFIKSEFRDFQQWKLALIDNRPMHYVCMRGMFVVAKENVEYINKNIYLNLLKSLSVGDNIENGHFAERIWAHLFRQYAFDKLELKKINPADMNK